MRECETKIFFWGCGLNPSLYGISFILLLPACDLLITCIYKYILSFILLLPTCYLLIIPTNVDHCLLLATYLLPGHAPGISTHLTNEK